MIGKIDPIIRVVGAVRRHRVGRSDRSRAAGVFMLAGPTGVGKTEWAKAIAHFERATALYAEIGVNTRLDGARKALRKQQAEGAPE